MNRLRSALVAASFIATAALATGCTSDQSNDSESDAPASAAFPVTLEHRLGTTTIPDKPERVVALGVPDTDVLLALDITPVAVVMADQWPWQLDKIDESDTEIWGLDADGPDLEAIAALEPDLILATGLGGNDAYYDDLSGIAPTLADKDGVLTTDWRVTAQEIGKAVGEEELAASAISKAEDAITTAREAHPAVEDSTYAAGFIYEAGSLDVETSAEMPQARLLADLGLVVEPSLASGELDDSEESSQVGAGTVRMSFEQLGKLDPADAVIIGVLDDELREQVENDRLVGLVSAVEDEQFVVLDRLEYTASSFVTIGSIDYAIAALTPLLASVEG